MTQALLYKVLNNGMPVGSSKGYDLIYFEPDHTDDAEKFIERNSITDYVIFAPGDHGTRDNINFSIRFRHAMYIENGVPVFHVETAKKIAMRLVKDSLLNPQRKNFNENFIPDQLLMLQFILPENQRHSLAQTAINRITSESNAYLSILDSILNATTMDEIFDSTYPEGTSPDYIVQ